MAAWPVTSTGTLRAWQATRSSPGTARGRRAMPAGDGGLLLSHPPTPPALAPPRARRTESVAQQVLTEVRFHGDPPGWWITVQQ
jgi:hypothetical protein